MSGNGLPATGDPRVPTLLHTTPAPTGIGGASGKRISPGRMGGLPRLWVMGDGDCWELEFVAGGGRLDAAEAQVEAHTANAVLITGDAETDGFGTPFACLAREGRIADLAAHDIHHIGQPFAEDTLGLYGVFDASRTKDGELDYFTNAR